MSKYKLGKRNKKKRMIIFLFLLLIMSLIFFNLLVCHHLKKLNKNKFTQISKPLLNKKKSKIEKPEQVILPIISNKELDNVLNSQHFSGTALVVRRGKIILNQSYGFSIQEKRVANNTTTQYCIGSAQKSIIATAILQLEEEGQLKIEDPVAKYIKDFPNGKQITLKNLLNHTSGLTGRAEGNEEISPEKIIKEIEAAGIDSTIGTWKYSDSNYATLAYILQKVTNQKMQDYIQKNIFKPANMKDTYFYESNRSSPNLANNYKEHEGQLETIRLPNLSQLFGAGDIYTTATDLYYYDQALMQGKLINDTEKVKMFTSGSESTYGMGFYVNPGSYSSHGVLGGFNTINTFTHTGLTYIILLANTNQVRSLGKVADHIYELLNQLE